MSAEPIIFLDCLRVAGQFDEDDELEIVNTWNEERYSYLSREEVEQLIEHLERVIA